MYLTSAYFSHFCSFLGGTTAATLFCHHAWKSSSPKSTVLSPYITHDSQNLLSFVESLSQSLQLEYVANTLLTGIRERVPCSACVLFLPEDEDSTYLSAHAVQGVNAPYLQGSLAPIGKHLTGRAFQRGEMLRTSYAQEDLILREVSQDTWVPFRSTLIIPLRFENKPLGTINLYSEQANAFADAVPLLLRQITPHAALALNNARNFATLEDTAYTDALTGLRNGRYLREHLESEINRANRDNTPFCVLNMDMDNFKPINDLYGHARGDQTLREIATILRQHVRNYNLVARSSGDEFVVVLTQTEREAAEMVANNLKFAIERYSQRLHLLEPDFPPLGISIGIALYPENGSDIGSLLGHSDAGMYEDKRSRRIQRQAA